MSFAVADLVPLYIVACDSRGIYMQAFTTAHAYSAIAMAQEQFAGTQDELGFALKGTTDAALVLQQSIV